MKKLLIAAIALILLLPGCASGTPQDTAVPTVAATTAPAATTAAATATAEPTPAPTVEPTPSPTAEPTASPTQDPAAAGFATAEVTMNNVEAALAGLFKGEEFEGLSTDNSAGNIYVTIYFKPAAYADEKDFVLQAARQAAPVLELLFTNPTILEVYFYADADLADSDGNAATTDVVLFDMTKDKAATTDWAKLKDAASADYQAMLDAVDSYNILPEFADKLK